MNAVFPKVGFSNTVQYFPCTLLYKNYVISQYWGHLSWSMSGKNRQKKVGKEWMGEPLHTDTYIGPPVASDSAAPCWEQRDWSWITKTSLQLLRLWTWGHIILLWTGQDPLVGGIWFWLWIQQHTCLRSPGPQSYWSWWYLHLQRSPRYCQAFISWTFFPLPFATLIVTV